MPTGTLERATPGWRPLADDAYDDLVPSLAAPAVFRVEAPERMIEVAFGEAYRCAQVYAPATADCIFQSLTEVVPFVWDLEACTRTQHMLTLALNVTAQAAMPLKVRVALHCRAGALSALIEP